MNTIPAQEIKRRGIAAVDGMIAKGDLHVIRNNQPQYVVLAEAEEGYLVRVKESLQDYKAWRVRKFASADELLQALDADEEWACTASPFRIRSSVRLGSSLISIPISSPALSLPIPPCSRTRFNRASRSIRSPANLQDAMQSA